MLDFTRFEYFTFDCYGTLIDWESGILAALRPLFERHETKATDNEILEAYAEIESRLESGPYRPYREVLRLAVHELGDQFRFIPDLNELPVLSESLRDWRPFPDTVPALTRIAERHKLAIISNIDDELFAYSAQHLQVAFAHVITAQQVGSYKPSLKNFEAALDRLGVAPEKVLHVAQSLFHDVTPARTLGLKTVWVNRRKGQQGHGATPASNAVPDLEVSSLAELANVVSKAWTA